MMNDVQIAKKLIISAIKNCVREIVKQDLEQALYHLEKYEEKQEEV